MKKIVFFIESLEGGGAEKSLTELIENMDKDKYDITVVTESSGEVYTERVKAACHLRCLTHKCMPENLLPYNLNRLIFRFINTAPRKILHKIIIGDKYDVEVACCEGFATKLIANSGNKNSRKIAFVHTDMQNNHWTGVHYKNYEEELECYKRFDAISCVSESVAAAFRHLFGIGEHVVVNHNPVNTGAIKRKAQEAIVLTSSNGLQIISVGRLSAIKSFDRLLRIVKQLKEDNYRFHLTIVGKGEKEQELQQYIVENDLSEYVQLVGFQSNPYKYILHSDFFVCSSLAEGFNTAVVESIVLGTPVVTTDCSGMKEAFGEKECGVICENTEEALFEAVKSILDSPQRLNEFSNNCRARAPYFDLKKCVAKVEGLF